MALLVWVALKHSIGAGLCYALNSSTRAHDAMVHLRKAFEELGLTYLKLGQFLATRYDVLPASVCQELSKLFEEVAPMPFADVRTVVERELNGPIELFFPVFRERPIGAASVGQVHEAWNTRNEHVAVKVQRTNIEQLFVTDMRILRRFARLIDALRLLGRLSVTELTDEFTTWTLREMNFLVEGRTAERIRKSALPFERVPRIHWDLTTARVLTIEFVEGLSLAQIANLLDQGGPELVRQHMPDLDLNQALHNLAFASLHQLFGIGFFHGDPHPGNIFVRGNNSVTFIDFGIFGSMNDYEREVVVGLAENIAVGNIDESFRYYAKELLPTDETDLRQFERDTKQILREWYEIYNRPAVPGAPAEEPRHLGIYIGAMIAVSQRNGMRMGRRYLLFWRAMNALDATMQRLSADFDLVSEMRRYFQATRPGFAERVLQVKADQSRITTLIDLAVDLPGQLTLLLDHLGDDRHAWPVQAGADPAHQQAANRQARWLSAALGLISLGLLLGAPLPAHAALLLPLVMLAGLLTRRVIHRSPPRQ